jgi:ComF family protein
MDLLSRFLQLFLPPLCPGCGRILEEGREGVCPACLEGIRWIRSPLCSICGAPFSSQEGGDHPCGSCLTRKNYFTIARALGSYQGTLREAIHRWKYGRKAPLGRLFGVWMAEGFNRFWPSDPPHLILPVPLHRHRLRERGFNQALDLASRVSRRTGIPFERRTLIKCFSTPPQAGLHAADRERAIRGVFRVAHGERIRGKRILLVDDVFTTGATANECARVLLAAGADRVDVFTLAHTPKGT